MIKEFKKFVFRGNVMDLAVGVVIGAAFTSIVNSLVNNIIMPFVGVLTAGINFKDTNIDLTPLAKALGNKNIPADGIPLSIGLFVNAIVEFFIIAIAVFLMIKLVNTSREKLEKITHKKEEENKPSKPVKSDEVKLLEEIRNLLKENNKSKSKKSK